jgi:hypothetical protein
MTKSFELISEAVRHSKHAFAKTESLSKKPMRNRYERRKVRKYLTPSDWQFGDTD